VGPGPGDGGVAGGGGADGGAAPDPSAPSPHRAAGASGSDSVADASATLATVPGAYPRGTSVAKDGTYEVNDGDTLVFAHRSAKDEGFNKMNK